MWVYPGEVGFISRPPSSPGCAWFEPTQTDLWHAVYDLSISPFLEPHALKYVRHLALAGVLGGFFAPKPSHFTLSDLEDEVICG